MLLDWVIISIINEKSFSTQKNDLKVYPFASFSDHREMKQKDTKGLILTQRKQDVYFICYSDLAKQGQGIVHGGGLRRLLFHSSLNQEN